MIGIGTLSSAYRAAVLARVPKKPHIFFRYGVWCMNVGGYEVPYAFLSIRHMQDYARTGRL
jgi:hypothetical protein